MSRDIYMNYKMNIYLLILEKLQKKHILNLINY